MSLFEKKTKDDYTVIIGCGRLGASLADTLSEMGCNVLILDSNKESFRKLSPDFGGLSVVGDGTDLDTLQEAEVAKATAVIVVTNNDNTNILISQICREIFKVKAVISRLYDPERECVYQEFDIDTICPAVLSVKEIDKLLSGMPRQQEVSQEAI